MFPTEESVLRQVKLETVTPEEALSIVQRLPAEMLSRAHFSYYESLVRAVATIAEAALLNRQREMPYRVPYPKMMLVFRAPHRARRGSVNVTYVWAGVDVDSV